MALMDLNPVPVEASSSTNDPESCGDASAFALTRCLGVWIGRFQRWDRHHD